MLLLMMPPQMTPRSFYAEHNWNSFPRTMVAFSIAVGRAAAAATANAAEVEPLQ